MRVGVYILPRCGTANETRNANSFDLKRFLELEMGPSLPGLACIRLEAISGLQRITLHDQEKSAFPHTLRNMNTF